MPVTLYDDGSHRCLMFTDLVDDTGASDALGRGDPADVDGMAQ